MSSDRWEHIQELYHAALELEPTQRSAFLKEACGDDEALCREVEALLAEHGNASGFLETPALELAAQEKEFSGVSCLSFNRSSSTRVSFALIGRQETGGIPNSLAPRLRRDGRGLQGS